MYNFNEVLENHCRIIDIQIESNRSIDSVLDELDEKRIVQFGSN